MLGCAHELKHVDLQWVESIGMVNKDTVCAMLVGLANNLKHNEAFFFDNFDLFVVFTSHSDAWMSRSGDFVVTNRQADKTDYFTPCACARDNKIGEFQINKKIL